MHKSQILLLTAFVTMSPLMFANAASAHGQEASAKTDMMAFSQLDTNHDGELTKSELPASSMHSKHFAKIDADGNGSLSQAEVDKHLVDDMGVAPDPVKKMDHDTMQGSMDGMDHGDMNHDTMEGEKADTDSMDHDDVPMDADGDS